MDNNENPPFADQPGGRNFHDATIQRAIVVARHAWHGWKIVLEDDATILLANPKVFSRFCAEYSVGRTIRTGTKEECRRMIRRLIRRAIKDPLGSGIDNLDRRLRPHFGTRNGRSMVSMISKVGAFYRPEVFVAWDKYARKGLNIMSNLPPSRNFTGYVHYLATVEQLWATPVRKQIESAVSAAGGCPQYNPPAFGRRVLDVALMIVGGRREFEVRPHSGPKRGAQKC